MFYYPPPPPPPPPPANIFHLAPGPYCSIPGPVGISGLFTFNQSPAPTAPTEEKAAKEKPKAPKKKILIPPLPPLLPPPPPPPLPAAEGKKEEKGEEAGTVAKEVGKPKKKDEPKEEKKEEGGKKEEKKEKKKKVINTYLPPQIPKGTNFWFAAEFTQLHIFNKGVRIWEEKWRGDRKAFKAFTVDIHWPVRSIIERTRNHNNAETTTEQQAAVCSGWAVTEVIEAGDNTFLKGTTVAYGSEKAKVSLASMGWNGKRGKSLPPVWLTVHKV
ncbi:hypothetical protein KC333_g1466 [Hortaea werneckii]|nr:hypothetical protein KC333_g1466 [Hortaea werneckii]KAI7320266.1 hypothetical protein KC326_g2752 [Hortaea werneckii]